jgi:hypothetical protein
VDRVLFNIMQECAPIVAGSSLEIRRNLATSFASTFDGVDMRLNAGKPDAAFYFTGRGINCYGEEKLEGGTHEDALTQIARLCHANWSPAVYGDDVRLPSISGSCVCHGECRGWEHTSG